MLALTLKLTEFGFENHIMPCEPVAVPVTPRSTTPALSCEKDETASGVYPDGVETSNSLADI